MIKGEKKNRKGGKERRREEKRGMDVA